LRMAAKVAGSYVIEPETVVEPCANLKLDELIVDGFIPSLKVTVNVVSTETSRASWAGMVRTTCARGGGKAAVWAKADAAVSKMEAMGRNLIVVLLRCCRA
jgi:hypothetical protein